MKDLLNRNILSHWNVFVLGLAAATVEGLMAKKHFRNKQTHTHTRRNISHTPSHESLLSFLGETSTGPGIV